jgi:hypothetical protein
MFYLEYPRRLTTGGTFFLVTVNFHLKIWTGYFIMDLKNILHQKIARNRGILYQGISSILDESVKPEDEKNGKIRYDWILEVNDDAYIRYVSIGKFVICQVPSSQHKKFVKKCRNTIFLKTKYKGWLLLDNKTRYVIETPTEKYNVWICKLLGFNDVIKKSPMIGELITDKTMFNSSDIKVKKIQSINARCNNSMKFLDEIHRNYITSYVPKKTNEVLVVKAIAGSGKTTSLLQLVKNNPKKRFLYLAFNKGLISEVKTKAYTQHLQNVFPKTFDAFVRNIYINEKNMEPNIIELKHHNITNIIPWLSSKPYKIKQYYINHYNKFCNQTKYTKMDDYCRAVLGTTKPLLNQMWESTVNNHFQTFDNVRKMVQMNRWAVKHVDNNYDMILIDEAQDFDDSMLKILLEDTTLPKLFVGDSKQAIYEWRGCINALDKMPDTSKVVEFYSTFRIGKRACAEIKNKFDDLWLYSRSSNDTVVDYDTTNTTITTPNSKNYYVYLFRTWKSLLEMACKSNDKLWIYNFDKQVVFMKKLHEKLQFSKLSEDEISSFSDDLPFFLLKLSKEELDELLVSVEERIVGKKEATCHMYTIHSYKGLEDDIIKIYDDIDRNGEENLYYVALTRGKQKIIVDKESTVVPRKKIAPASKLASKPKKPRKPREPSKGKKQLNHEKSFNLYKNGKSIDEIATELKFTKNTIQQHLIKYIGVDNSGILREKFIKDDDWVLLKDAFEKHGIEKLKPIKDEVGRKISYETIKWAHGFFTHLE